MCCCEVSLGAPAVKIKKERCSARLAGQQHYCLGVQWLIENVLSGTSRSGWAV